MARAVIISSYLEHPVDLVEVLKEGDLVVAVDGGYDIAIGQGIKPHILLGDLDSLEGDVPEGEALEILRYPPEKDYTDMELALMSLDPSQQDEVLILGGLGGRLDHTVANLQLLERYTRKSGETTKAFRHIEMMDGKDRCFVVHGPTDPTGCRIEAVEDAYLSLLPLSKSCEGVSLKGVKYPLEGEILYRGATLSVSNEIEEEAALLEVGSGSLLVTISARR